MPLTDTVGTYQHQRVCFIHEIVGRPGQAPRYAAAGKPIIHSDKAIWDMLPEQSMEKSDGGASTGDIWLSTMLPSAESLKDQSYLKAGSRPKSATKTTNDILRMTTAIVRMMLISASSRAVRGKAGLEQEAKAQEEQRAESERM